MAESNSCPAQPMENKISAPSTIDKIPPSSVFTRSSIIRFVIGKTKPQTLSIHKDLVSFYSGYFKAKFSTAQSTEVVSLNDVDEVICELFCGWLYTGRLSCSKGSGHCLTPNILLSVWVFADKHLIPLLQNHTIDRLFERKASFPHLCYLRDISFAYANTAPGSKLRLALVDIACLNCASSEELVAEYGANLEVWNKEFLFDVFVAFGSPNRVRKTDKEGWKKLNTCKYHVHPEGITCKVGVI